MMQVGFAAVGVDQVTVFIASHCIDGQITPLQILFKGHIGRGMKRKAFIARCGLALGSCQRIFLVSLGMQKYRKICADPFVASGQHLFDARTDDDKITILHGQTQQPVAYRTANGINFHLGLSCAEISKQISELKRRQGFRGKNASKRPLLLGF